jgi:hypothetical protein
MTYFKVVRLAKQSTVYNYYGSKTPSLLGAGTIVGLVPANTQVFKTTAAESNNLRKIYGIKEDGIFIALPNYFLVVNKTLGSIEEAGHFAHIVNAKDCYIDKITNTYFRPELLDKVVVITSESKSKVPIYRTSTGNEIKKEVKATFLTEIRDSVIGYPDGLYADVTRRISIVDTNNEWGWVDVRDVVLKKRSENFDVNTLIEAFNKYFAKPLAQTHNKIDNFFKENIQDPIKNAKESVSKGIETIKIIGVAAGIILLLSKMKND